MEAALAKQEMPGLKLYRDIIIIDVAMVIRLWKTDYEILHIGHPFTGHPYCNGIYLVQTTLCVFLCKT